MLNDGFGRHLDYLRVSVTDKCNLRCIYCIPPEGVTLLDHDDVLRNEEFVRLVELFGVMGIKKVRFTGGEPLVRKGLLDIVGGVKRLVPSMDICLTTNGVLLEGALEDLKSLGVRKLNISLDTLSRERFKEVTGRDEIARVLSSIDRALDLEYFEIKINTVLFQETIDELEGLLDYFSERRCSLRFIERMPFGGSADVVPASALLTALGSLGTFERDPRTDTSVARMYRLRYRDGKPVNIGVIPTITHKFCASCNRLRLSCDGLLRTCLHSPVVYDLKNLMRTGQSDDAVRDMIIRAVKEKPKEHSLRCESGHDDGCASLSGCRSMSRIGG